MCKNGRDGEQGFWREGRLTDQLYSQELARPSEAPSPHPSRPESPRFGDAANATTSESNEVIIISNSDKKSTSEPQKVSYSIERRSAA